MRTRSAALALVVLGVLVSTILGGAGTAQAHPLGNFTVNHYDGITLHPNRVDVAAVLDSAEIPTAQELPALDINHDGTTSAEELSAASSTRCAELAGAITASVAAQVLGWQVHGATLVTVPGAAGLPTLRLQCSLTAAADLSTPTRVSYSDSYQSDRVGWHEITVAGEGVRTINSPVPAATVSDELRSYPNDLLSSPLNTRSVQLQVEPGTGAIGGVTNASTSNADPFTRILGWADRTLQDLVGRGLTPLLGFLAVLLALLLGCGHALLPGHGKTVMAAYLAGRSGSKRDAVTVGATVTLTHTAGVLILGVLLSVFRSLIGEQVLGWLGVISGLLVAAIGVTLVRTALRSRHTASETIAGELALVGAAGTVAVSNAHAHGHDHGHGHGHGHGHEQRQTRSGLIGMGVAGGLVPSPSALIVLLASVHAGSAIFGIVLVVLYGVGMASTLTAIGLLLVRVRGRLGILGATGRLRGTALRLAGALPLLTASVVLVVGLTLAARSTLGVL